MIFQYKSFNKLFIVHGICLEYIDKEILILAIDYKWHSQKDMITKFIRKYLLVLKKFDNESNHYS